MTNTLGIMLEILYNYLWTRLSVRIIGAIKRQFFHMVRHVFDNSNLSQKMFVIGTWRPVICSLGRSRKHMLTILPTIWRPGLRLQLHGPIYRPDSFVLMLRYCANFKEIRYESTSLRFIGYDSIHRVIVA